MGLFERLFGRTETNTTARPSGTSPHQEEPAGPPPAKPYAGLEGIRFGRYNDNNKSFAQIGKWRLAEDYYKEKKYRESITAFFEYLRDDQEHNVVFEEQADGFRFEIRQGSKRVYGKGDNQTMIAHAPIAVMDAPSVAVMRRLLDLNYNLYYSRCAINDQNELTMLLDFSLSMAAPDKLYHGLRELATRADRLDDQLLHDFTRLKAANNEHITPLPERERDIKFTYFRKWIDDTMAAMAGLNPDSFAGAIAYLMLTLLYRIEFLLVPEGNLLTELERAINIYWARKEEVALVERNKLMKDAILKLRDLSKEAFTESVYRTTATFSVVTPAANDKLRENISSANRTAVAYVDDKYPELAMVLNEYGVVHNQFTYSTPLVIKELTKVYMAVIHAGFFRELGMVQPFYDPETKTFNRAQIEAAVDDAIHSLPDKYEGLHWDHSRVRYDALFDFGISFTSQMNNLNLEIKK